MAKKKIPRKHKPTNVEEVIGENPEQVEMFYKVRLDYTTLLNTMIDKGEMAELGTDAVCILLIMRRYTQVYETNDPYCKITKKKIAELTGLSERTVNRKIKKLEEEGYIKTVNQGFKQRNAYVLTEKLLAISQVSGTSDKVLKHTFIPYLRQKRLNEIRYYEKYGVLPPRSPIDVKKAATEFKQYNINVNITNNFGSTIENQVNINVKGDESVDISTLPKWIQDKVIHRINAKAEESTKLLKQEIEDIIETVDQSEKNDNDGEI